VLVLIDSAFVVEGACEGESDASVGGTRTSASCICITPDEVGLVSVLAPGSVADSDSELEVWEFESTGTFGSAVPDPADAEAEGVTDAVATSEAASVVEVKLSPVKGVVTVEDTTVGTSDSSATA
jgi:hypothetical protein